jgi:CDP-glucose 4,6-dehydratase
VRPWQHVLDPLAGYLALAVRLLGEDGHRWARAWNFGPDAIDDATVGEVARRVAERWGDDARIERGMGPSDHESTVLRLDSQDARTQLGWRPAWSLDETITRTVDWYRAWVAGEDVAALSRSQIAEHARAVAA